jgi:hypothetical protein
MKNFIICTLHQTLKSCGETKKGEMSGTCIMRGKVENVYLVLGRKPEMGDPTWKTVVYAGR